jgi:dehydrogenase/reductase SDR family member 12
MRRALTVRLAERRTVTHPRHDAFAYTADFANIEGWDPGVVASEAMGAGPVGLGSRFNLVVRSGAGTLPMVYEITELDPDRRVVLRGAGKDLEAVDEIRLEPQGDALVVHYTADLTFHGPVRLLGPVLRVALRRVGRRAVDGLAAALQA